MNGPHIRFLHSVEKDGMGMGMTAKCGSCYWNVTLPSCAYSYMALHGEDCDEWRPAKEYERGRPRGGRGGA